MNKIFKYCLLKYRPSYVLSEQVNIGILFVFADDSKVIFEFPTKLQRLSVLFSDTDLNYVKRYLNTFTAKAKELTKSNLFVTQQFEKDELIEKEFLIADANSFFFSEWKVGTYGNIEKIVEHYKQLYFSPYYFIEENTRKDDEYLIKQFHDHIKDKGKAALFQKNKRIAIRDLHWDFDVCWQNGTTNLVRSLSFDLKSKDYFIDKANKHFGSITQLERKEFDTSNVCFDFWVVKPNDHALYKTYENAIDILSSLTSKHRIIEEEKDFERYIEEALDTVKLIDLNIFAKEEQKSIEDN